MKKIVASIVSGILLCSSFFPFIANAEELITNISSTEPTLSINTNFIDNTTNQVYDTETISTTELLDTKTTRSGETIESYVTTVEVYPSDIDNTSLSKNSRAAATNYLTAESWKNGVTGIVKVYYHKQRINKNFAWNYDMNYIEVSWTAPSGSTISNRKVKMIDKGKSNYGVHSSNMELSKTPSSNSKTKYDVPDEWLPIFEGILGATSTATVKKGSSQGTLTVDTRILNLY